MYRIYIWLCGVIGEAEEQSAQLGVAAKNRCWWRPGEVIYNRLYIMNYTYNAYIYTYIYMCVHIGILYLYIYMYIHTYKFTKQMLLFDDAKCRSPRMLRIPSLRSVWLQELASEPPYSPLPKNYEIFSRPLAWLLRNSTDDPVTMRYVTGFGLQW